MLSPDGGFIFSVQTHPYVKDNGLIWEKSCIIKCDQDGKELWKRDFDDYAGGLLRHLFITESDEVIVVGQWRSKNGQQTKDDAVVHAKENENFVYDQLAFSKGFIYVLGNYVREGNTPINGFLVKLDKSGNRVWTKSQLYTGLWGRVVSVLQNGDIAIGLGQRFINYKGRFC